ncbi:hypothetical protein PST407_01351 [Pseudomonas syringae pv. tomato]|nr:hypothetical protein PST407_01351 [Pseudomonas syringae pv. tomato]
MRVSHVAADDHHAVAQLKVLVAARRRIGPQAALVAGHGRRHAQPRVAVDVVGADQRAGQLVERVVVLGQQLAGNVERHAVGAVFANALGKHGGGVLQCGVPIGHAARQPFAQAQLRVQRPCFDVAGQVQARTFAAQLAEVRRVLGIAADAENALPVMLDQHPAADAAIAAGGCRHLSALDGQAGHAQAAGVAAGLPNIR